MWHSFWYHCTHAYIHADTHIILIIIHVYRSIKANIHNPTHTYESIQTNIHLHKWLLHYIIRKMITSSRQIHAHTLISEVLILRWTGKQNFDITQITNRIFNKEQGSSDGFNRLRLYRLVLMSWKSDSGE